MYSSKQLRRQAINFLERVSDRLGDCAISNADTVRLYYYPIGYVAEIKEGTGKRLYCKVDKVIVGLNVDKVLNAIKVVNEVEIEGRLF